MWHTVIAILGIPVSVLIYCLLYRWRFDVAVKLYIAARAAGKRPLLITGDYWFSYYEDYDPLRYPPNLDYSTTIASGGRVAVIVHQLKIPWDD